MVLKLNLHLHFSFPSILFPNLLTVSWNLHWVSQVIFSAWRILVFLAVFLENYLHFSITGRQQQMWQICFVHQNNELMLIHLGFHWLRSIHKVATKVIIMILFIKIGVWSNPNHLLTFLLMFLPKVLLILQMIHNNFQQNFYNWKSHYSSFNEFTKFILMWHFVWERNSPKIGKIGLNLTQYKCKNLGISFTQVLFPLFQNKITLRFSN